MIILKYNSILGYHYKTHTFLCFPPHMLEISTTLHVVLIVFLRMSALANPLSRKHFQRRHRCLYISIIWLLSALYCSLPLILLVQENWKDDWFFYIRLFGLHCFGTLPVISIIIMWGIMINVAQTKQANEFRISNNSKQLMADSNNRSMSAMVKWLVIVLIICYVPYIIWKQYFYVMILRRNSGLIYTEKVKTFFLVGALDFIFNVIITLNNLNPFYFRKQWLEQ